MKILVPTKRVPDTDQRIRVRADGSGIEFENLPFVINPFDAIAVDGTDLASLQEKLAGRVGGFLPYMFIIFGFLGAMYPGIDLGAAILLSRGEAETGGRENPAILADVCEAVIAALYFDGGLACARGFIERHWRPRIEAAARPPMDAKTTLQEWAQGRSLPRPSYREVGREGPDHGPVFTVEVTVVGHPPLRGTGASKRAGEQTAAARLLRTLGQWPPE